MSTEDFSSSTPQDSLEDQLHPPDGDSTPTATQPPHPRQDLSDISRTGQLSRHLTQLAPKRHGRLYTADLSATVCRLQLLSTTLG